MDSMVGAVVALDSVLTVALDRLRFLYDDVEDVSPLPDAIKTVRDNLSSLEDAIRPDSSRTFEDGVDEWQKRARELASFASEFEEKVEHLILQNKSGRKRNVARKAGVLGNWRSELESVNSIISTLHETACREGGTSQCSGYQAAFRFRPHFLDKNVVGRQEEMQQLVGYVRSKDERYRVVSIFGKRGLGKTALANKVSDRISFLHHFENIAWVRVKQKCHARIVLRDIAKQLLPGKEDEITGLGDKDLVLRLYSHFKEKKCLVVLDDIRSMDTWNSIKIAFPTGQDTGSKILLTTRSEEVAAAVGFCHKLRVLNDRESWKLLMQGKQNKVLLDARMTDIGKELVKKCGGRPLVIFLLRGLLQEKVPEELSKVYEVVKSFTRSQSQEQEDAIYWQLLSLAYNDLPAHLKVKFHYLGHFINDTEIEAEKLYQMWFAEGLLDPDLPGERAEDFLHELAIKSMVQVQIDESGGGGFTYCSINSIQRQLSLSKEKEIGLQAGSSTPRMRRLARYFDNGKEGNGMSEIDKIPDLRGFDSLKILDFEGLDFRKRKLPEGIEGLVLLRFLSFRGCYLQELPSSISNLRYLQTLDLRVNGHVFVPNVLRKMRALRFLYLPNIFVTTGSKLNLDGISWLEILKCFNMSMCEVDNLETLKKLQKLEASTEGNDEDLEKMIKYLGTTSNGLRHLSIKISEWDCYSSKRLKLLGNLFGLQSLCSLNLEGRIKLPEYSDISKKLSELVLDGSQLEKDPMATLENLSSLTSLSLIGEVMVVDEMVCSANGFPKLGTLRLRDIPYLKRWKVHAGAMPSLSYLEVHACKELKIFPKELRSKTLKPKITEMPESFNLLKVSSSSSSSIPSTSSTVSSHQKFLPFFIVLPMLQQDKLEAEESGGEKKTRN